MLHKSYYESPKEINNNIFDKIICNKEVNLENILENENYIKDLRTNPNNPLKVIFTTDNIKIMVRYCIKSAQNNNNSKIRDNLCEILCSHYALFFKKSIYNIKLSNKLINRYNNMTKIEKNSIKEAKNENDEKEGNYLEIIPFKKVKFNNKIIFISNENIIENKDSIVKLFKDQNSYEIRNANINKRDICEFDKEEINIINEILDEIFDISNFSNYEKKKDKENSNLFYFQKLVNFLLCFESDTIINYLIKDTNFQIIKFLMNNLNRAEIFNILENILNILSGNEEPNNNIIIINFKFQKYAQIIKDLVNMIIEECKNNKFDKIVFICKLIINTVVNNSANQLIELFIENDILIQRIKKLIKEVVSKNSFKHDCDKENVIVNILQVLCQLNNVITTSFNESNFYKDNKKDIDIPQINDNNINKKSISYKNVFKAFENKPNLYLSNINDIFVLISEDIIELYKINVNNNGKDNQEISLDNLIKWEFILSCLKLYIYSYYAIKDFNNTISNSYFSSGQNLMKIAIQYYLKFPQNDSYLNIFLEIIQLICCEKCPEFLISPFLKTSEEKTQKQNEFIFQLKNSLEKFIKNKQYDSIDHIVKILKTFYTSSNNAILNFFNNSNLDKDYKNNFIICVKSKIEKHLNEEYEYSNSEIFNSDDDDENTFDGNDKECFRESELLLILIEQFITKCNNIVK